MEKLGDSFREPPELPAAAKQRKIPKTRIGESFKRKAVQVLSPPKSGPGSGLVKRAKTETSVTISGILPHNYSTRAVEAFHAFDVVPKVPFDTPPLTKSQLAKALELKEGALVAIHSQKKATREDFDQNAWKALDRVNFALTQEHLENLCELFNIPYHKAIEEFDIHEALIAETLAKALAYTENLDGQTIKLPVKTPEGKYTLKEFTISKLVLGENLPCYILRSEGEKTWVVPRGTEIATKKTEGVEHRQGAMESILADCDPEGIGYKALKSTEFINSLFQEKGQLLIAGHSLGGLIANELAARYPGKVEHAYGFSAPGISHETFKASSKVALDKKITNFQVEGDLVPSAGRHVVGRNFAVATKAQDAIHAHLEHNLNRPKVTCTLIDNEKESQKLLRRVSEATRKNIGGVLLKASALFKKAPDWAK